MSVRSTGRTRDGSARNTAAFLDRICRPTPITTAHLTISTRRPSGAFRTLICAGMHSASAVRCLTIPTSRPAVGLQGLDRLDHRLSSVSSA